MKIASEAKGWLMRFHNGLGMKSNIIIFLLVFIFLSLYRVFSTEVPTNHFFTRNI